VAGTTYAEGAPSWFELSTNDEAAALRFYGALFGWRDDPQPMGEGMGAYHHQRLDGQKVAAISAQMPQEAQQGVPPHWSVYLNVRDVDAAAARAAAAGGQVLMAPMDVMVDSTGQRNSAWSLSAGVS